MVHASAREALVPRQVATAAIVAAAAAAVGLYQATSLLLGPAAERQIALSLSTPAALEDGPLPALPATQMLEVGQAVAGRVERGLAALPFALRPVSPNAAPDATPSGSAQGPAPVQTVVPQPPIVIGYLPAAGHDRAGVLPGAHALRPAGRDLGWPPES